jgi:hypothetical protein
MTSPQQLAFPGQSKLDIAFDEFHERHPEVLDWLRERAVQLVDAGHKRLSIGMLWEALRMETMLGDRGAQYRLNDHLRSRYARLLMATDVRLDGVFETRALRERGEHE